MLTLTRLREERDSVIEALKKRGLDVTESVDTILSLMLKEEDFRKNLMTH